MTLAIIQKLSSGDYSQYTNVTVTRALFSLSDCITHDSSVIKINVMQSRNTQAMLTNQVENNVNALKDVGNMFSTQC